MNLKFKYILLILLLTLTEFSFAQKKVNVRVELPANIDYTKMRISFNDGIMDNEINPTIKNGVFTFSDMYYSRYGMLSFTSYDSERKDGIPCYSYWLTGKQSSITFNQDAKIISNPFSTAILVNAISVSENGLVELQKFIKKESVACQNYYLSNITSFANNEEIRNIFSEKKKKLNNKTLSFIKTNADLYYSLWVFNEEFAGTYLMGADTLLKFFHQVFPDSLKNTFEGREAVKKLNARINTSIGGEAPGFEVKDENGESIKLSALRGKYVLLDFWASWCGPCIKLMPELNKIRDRYSKNKLEVISISLDENRDAYLSALKKNNINCIHLNDSKFVQTYTIGPIPHMLLIDKDGIVIYNMKENNDYNLIMLKSILQSIFNE